MPRRQPRRARRLTPGSTASDRNTEMASSTKSPLQLAPEEADGEGGEEPGPEDDDGGHDPARQAARRRRRGRRPRSADAASSPGRSASPAATPPPSAARRSSRRRRRALGSRLPGSGGHVRSVPRRRLAVRGRFELDSGDARPVRSAGARSPRPVVATRVEPEPAGHRAQLGGEVAAATPARSTPGSA